MRSDMHKVVTERPRYGHSNPSRKWHARVGEEFEDRMFVSSSRRRQYGWHAKEFSDFLSPLRRFLRAQVGRPWDKVYSEIRKALPNGLHSEHLWSHIKSEVIIHCIERDGCVYSQPRYLYGEVKVSGLYVHPRTKLLCYKGRTPRRDSEKSAPTVNWIRIGENEEYRRINGIWYYRKFVRLDVGGPPALQLIKKKQLNRRELQELRDTYPGAR